MECVSLGQIPLPKQSFDRWGELHVDALFLRNLAVARNLFLSGAGLTGGVPCCLADKPTLQQLYLSNNLLVRCACDTHTVGASFR